jgi:hypothetical protein
VSRAASFDNADWGLTVETAACDRWHLDHTANDRDAPHWFDAIATCALRDVSVREQAFGTVTAGTPIEAKAARLRVDHGDSQRRGLWWLCESSHRRLLDEDGEYALGVYTPTQGVLHLELRPAWWVDRRVSAWSACGTEHRAQRAARIPWSRVFDPGEVRS